MYDSQKHSHTIHGRFWINLFKDFTFERVMIFPGTFLALFIAIIHHMTFGAFLQSVEIFLQTIVTYRCDVGIANGVCKRFTLHNVLSSFVSHYLLFWLIFFSKFDKKKIYFVFNVLFGPIFKKPGSSEYFYEKISQPISRSKQWNFFLIDTVDDSLLGQFVIRMIWRTFK